ncbi:thiosulfate sulfurtransferase 16, chloroplastic [Arabidopsis lyrata subsp. lyrata]|uniref:thiosulfate sulfurtransferase 16, chloroplastic n=1 Tax=Arabidopsis lyrata subsp. lyrata TaxID=81972 RepID=UPI000A29CF8D|nr:thiosulfate sulfurtransferase 16, chloroplastic [Arabidopsis lyrata subsp. lyrata]|eukprot:XP_020871743.1 thiosulfate sulfurtransferase 16, chloroplastic [Arabidopsis lyrata subsp. lyrata]
MAEERRVPSSVSVTVAHDLLLAGHRYLDVRTPEEFRQGHACGAINVPCMNRGVSGMSKNPDFLEQVSSHFGQSDNIIVGCQSGGRSIKATTDLFHAGFTGVKDIAGGYSAWSKHGLPTKD